MAKLQYVKVTTCAMCGGEDVFLDALIHCNNGSIRDNGQHWCDDCEDSCDVVESEVPANDK